MRLVLRISATKQTSGVAEYAMICVLLKSRRQDTDSEMGPGRKASPCLTLLSRTLLSFMELFTELCLGYWYKTGCIRFRYMGH